MAKFLRYCLLIMISAITLFLIYPVLHEAGHAAATLILGGRVSGYALLPLPHIESGFPYENTGAISIVSLAGLLFPFLCAAPFVRTHGYKCFVALLLMIITAIACVVEICIVVEYQMGNIVSDDDIVLFLTSSNLEPIWAYVYTGSIFLCSSILIFCMRPLQILEELASR